EAAYARMGIQRRRDTKLRGVRLSALDADLETRLGQRASELPALPMTAMGCSKLDRAASRSEQAPPYPAQAAPTVAPASPPGGQKTGEPSYQAKELEAREEAPQERAKGESGNFDALDKSAAAPLANAPGGPAG